MTVPWYILSEEVRFLVDGFITESTNSCGYLLSNRSWLMFLISLLKSVWSWHTTLARLITLWRPPFYVIWVVALEVQITTFMCKFPVHSLGQFWTPLHDHSNQRFLTVATAQTVWTNQRSAEECLTTFIEVSWDMSRHCKQFSSSPTQLHYISLMVYTLPVCHARNLSIQDMFWTWPLDWACELLCHVACQRVQ
jgi:ligand-binding SRPBCC domain-containing protein